MSTSGTGDHLRLTAGALAPDGGSIYLDGVSDGGKPIRIFLDWSLAAQESKATRLEIDDRIIPKGSPEEADWIAGIAAADPGGSETVATFRDSLLAKLRSATYAEGRAPRRGD